jgi:hypothetical protein
MKTGAATTPATALTPVAPATRGVSAVAGRKQ